jgi:hypothetical protein
MFSMPMPSMFTLLPALPWNPSDVLHPPPI